MWFSAEGDQRLKDSYTTDDTLVCTEKALQHFDLLLTQSKVLQRCKNRGLKIRNVSLIWLSVFHFTYQPFSRSCKYLNGCYSKSEIRDLQIGGGKFHLTSNHLSQEKQQHALTLVTEAEGIVGTSDSSPAADIFRTLVSTFKSNIDDFMLRAEQRYKELDTLVHVHRFCEQVCLLSLLHVFPPI